jgi:hypothetical protein
MEEPGMRPSTVITIAFLLVICAAHLVRVIYRMEIVAGGVTIPLWASVAASLGTAALAGWIWRDQRR